MSAMSNAALAATEMSDSAEPVDVYLGLKPQVRAILRSSHGSHRFPRLAPNRELLTGKKARRGAGGAFGNKRNT